MTLLFGLPILVAVVAGIFFPYAALSLMPLGFVFLFILMLLSGFSVDWGKLPTALKHPWELLFGLFLLFFFFPLLQLLLAKYLIRDAQFLVGLVFGSLMPVAFVAPFFTGLVEGDEELAFLLLVVSMLLAPLLAPLLLRLLTASVLPIQIAPLMKSMALLVTLPLLASFIICRYLPRLRRAILPHLASANMIFLGMLIFILFGTAVGRLNLGYESKFAVGKLLLLAFIQDFGVLFLARLFLGKLLAARAANAIMVSLAMKNVAIAAGVFLFYDPRASLPPAMVFIAHAFLFSFIPAGRKLLLIRKAAPPPPLEPGPNS